MTDDKLIRDILNDRARDLADWLDSTEGLESPLIIQHAVRRVYDDVMEQARVHTPPTEAVEDDIPF